MATPRRLINKKAYEELVLLKKFCDNIDDDEKEYCPLLQINNEFKEEFVILIKNTEQTRIKMVLTGKNYAKITKELMEYLNAI